MASAVITITDKVKGPGLNVHIAFDPPLDKESEDHPLSQQAAVIALGHLTELLGE